jgi:hypothetical protein
MHPFKDFLNQTFSQKITIFIVVNTRCAVSLELDMGRARMAIAFRRLGQLESRSTAARIYRINDSGLCRGILYFIMITLICLDYGCRSLIYACSSAWPSALASWWFYTTYTVVIFDSTERSAARQSSLGSSKDRAARTWRRLRYFSY